MTAPALPAWTTSRSSRSRSWAGETMGTTEVMAVEDGMAEDMEMLTLYGMVDGLQTNSVSFNLWDAAVPALPVIAQLLLAAFLALGGYRRYLRR